MNTELNLDAIKEAIATVEHPEIAAGLTDLGMIGDVAFDAEEKSVTLTLLLPTLGVPEQIRTYLLNSIAAVLQSMGVEGLRYGIQEMDEEAKQQFFAMAQAGWKL